MSIWFHTCCLSRKYSLTPLRSCIPLWDYGWFIFKARNSLFMLIYLPVQSIVSKNALQYRGNSQHDAQEFLLWLLDRVHEDLNHAVKQSGQPPLKVRARPQGSQGVLSWMEEGVRVDSSQPPLSSCCSLQLVNTVKLTK